MRKIIDLGETLRLYTEYEDVNTGDAIDPPVLTCMFKRPDETVETLTYPHADLVREAPGRYYVRLEGTQIGTWYYRIYAEINADDKDVRDGKFDVEPSL